MGRLTALEAERERARQCGKRCVQKTCRPQQVGPAIERATSPFQYALSTRAGTECVAHAVHSLTDLDHTATVVRGGRFSDAFRAPILRVCIFVLVGR